MQSCAELMDISKESNTRNSSYLPSANISIEEYFDKLLFTLKWIIEYVFGINAGVIAIAIINNVLLSQRIVSFCEKGNTDPGNIAQALGKSIGQIENKMSDLITKNKIIR